MVTRWILNSLFGSVTDSAKRGLLGVKTDAQILTDTVHDFVTTPSEKQTNKKREERRQHYQATVSRVKAHQEERKAIDLARNTPDDSKQKREALASCKDKAKELLAAVEEELTDISKRYFQFLLRNQISLKLTEKEALNKLLLARTLAEFKLISANHMPVLEKLGCKNKALREFLSEIINDGEDPKIEKKTSLSRK